MSDRPYSPETILARVAELSAIPKTTPIADWKWKSAKGALQKAAGSEANRYLILFWLFPGKWANVDAVTTNDLTPAQARAIYNWVAPYKDEFDGGKWKGHEALDAECAAILKEIVDSTRKVVEEVIAVADLRKEDPELAEATAALWSEAEKKVAGALKRAAENGSSQDNDLSIDPANFETMGDYYLALYGPEKWRMPCGCMNDSYSVFGRPVCSSHATVWTTKDIHSWLDVIHMPNSGRRISEK